MGLRTTRSLFGKFKSWFQTIVVHHSLVSSSNKLDMVIDRACLVHYRVGTTSLDSQFPTATFFNCRGVQPHSISHTEGLLMFLIVSCQFVSLVGLLQVTTSSRIGLVEVLMCLFHKNSGIFTTLPSSILVLMDVVPT